MPQWSLHGGGAKFHSGLFRVGGPSSTAVSSGRGGPSSTVASSGRDTKFHSVLFRERRTSSRVWIHAPQRTVLGEGTNFHSGLFRQGRGNMFHSGLFREGGPSFTVVSPRRKAPDTTVSLQRSPSSTVSLQVGSQLHGGLFRETDLVHRVLSKEPGRSTVVSTRRRIHPTVVYPRIRLRSRTVFPDLWKAQMVHMNISEEKDK